MKKTLFILLVGFCCFIYAQEFPDLKGEYLGQTPPGDTPEVFARGIISDKYQQHGAPNGALICFSISVLPTYRSYGADAITIYEV